MTVPTYKKPALIREIDALRIQPDEVLVLRFSDDMPVEEIELFDAALKQGPLKGRVVMMRFNGEMAVVKAPA